MFYGVPRLHLKDNYIFFPIILGLYLVTKESRFKRLNLDIWTIFTFLVFLIENPLCCGPQCALGKVQQCTGKLLLVWEFASSDYFLVVTSYYLGDVWCSDTAQCTVVT